MKGLKAIRKRKGITQEALGALTGIEPNTLSRYERGTLSPSAKAVMRIAEALNVSVDELLNGPASQEFEVKIMMGVKSLTGLAGIEVASNSFLYGVDDSEPQIVLAGKVMIGTPEEREKALAEIIRKFKAACWMFDHKGAAEAEA
ncbi:MAG: helix-turn-helix transcriptional regulator [Synergistaceae bacterium]|nr:helix-turn-helix transcriptional regulator [Synergistaceae bacterium]